MPLAGALLKHRAKLTRLDALRKSLLRQAGRSPRQQLPKRLRSGAIQKAVVDTLRASSEPIHAAKVHLAVERRLGAPVSKDSVHSCLSTGALGEDSQFERLGRGLYQLRDVSSGT